MNRLVPVLAAGLLPVICFATGMYLLRIEARRQRERVRRLLAMAPPGRPSTLPAVIAPMPLSVARPTASARRIAQRCIGMDPDRQGGYPLSPWLLLPLALLPGAAMRWLLHSLLGPAAWLLLPVVWILFVRMVYRGSDARRSAILLKQFPDALATIVRAVRVGIPVAEAIAAVARDADEPTATEFGRVREYLAIGTPLEDALRAMANRSRLSEYRFFATAISLQSQAGGGLTETLESLADIIRKRVALKARGYALAAEARTSAAVLAALPVFSGTVLAVINPGYIAPLLHEGPGQKLFGIAVVWLGIGMLVMRWLINKSLS